MTGSKSPLQPLKEPIGLRTESIVSQRSILLVTQRHSWSGGDFTVRTPDGVTILTSSGKLASTSGRKEFKDASGLPLFDLKMSWFSLSNSWYLELPGGQRILSVRSKWFLRRLKLEVTLRNVASRTHEEVTLKVHGEDFHLGSTRVLWQERPVAVVRKKLDLLNTKPGVTSEFEVEVAAGMDQVLASVIAIVLADQNMLTWGVAVS